MQKFDIAQQLISQLVPNLGGSTKDLFQSLKGNNFVADTDPEVSFDKKLNEAQQARDDRSPRAEDAAPTREQEFKQDAQRRSDSANREDALDTSIRKELARAEEQRQANGGEPKAAAKPQDASEGAQSAEAAPVKSEEAVSESPEAAATEEATATTEVTGAETAPDEAVAAASAVQLPYNEVEKLLNGAQELFKLVEAFQAENPTLSAQIPSLVDPIKTSLAQIIEQLSALTPGVPVSADQLKGNAAQGLVTLQQIAQAFNQLQAGTPLNAATLALSDAGLPQELTQTLQPLQKASAEAITKLNNIVNSVGQLSNTTNELKAKFDIDSLLKSASIITDAPVKQATQATIVVGQQQDTPTNVKLDAQALVKAASNSNVQAQGSDGKSAGDQSSNQSGGQPSANPQAQANAQALGQQLNPASTSALQASAARGDSAFASQLSSTSSVSSAPSAPSAPGGVEALGSQTINSLTKQGGQISESARAEARGQVSEQVQFQMKMMLKNGQQQMVVKLSPVELGQLEIKLQTGKETQVVINVERMETLKMLQNDSRMLVQALQDAGLQADSSSLSFNFQGDNNSGDGSQQHSKNVYPVAADEVFDEQQLAAVASENYTLDLEPGVNIQI